MDFKYRKVGFISLKDYRSLMAYKKNNIKINNILCRILFIVYMKKHITIKPNILWLKTDHEYWDFQYYQNGKTRFL